MSKSIKIAFLGLGEHARRAHIKHLRAMNEQGSYAGRLQLVGAFDPSADAFVDVARHEGVQLHRFEQLGDVFAAKPDAIFICAPDQFHTVYLQHALEKGAHVFCEKPMAVTQRDASGLELSLELARLRGLVVSSCHPRRFDPPFLELKKQLLPLQQKYGPLRHFDFSFFYHEVTDEWKKSRSLLSDHVGHELDLLRYLFGVPVFEATKLADAYDCYEVAGRAGQRITFRFFGSRALPTHEYIETVRLDFARESLFINVSSGEGHTLLGGESLRFPAIDYDARFLSVNENFLDAVTGRGKSYLTHQDMLANNLTSVGLDKTGAASFRESE